MATASYDLATALAYFSAGRTEEAERVCQQILAVEPSCVDALHVLGVIAYQTGKYDVAIASLGQALEVNPNNAEVYYNQGNALKCAGRLNEAVACYRQALNLKPDYAEAHNNLGNVLHEQGQAEDAVACYRRAIELKPEYAMAYFNLGNALRRLKKLDDAAACYVRSLELNPSDVEARINLGRVLSDQGRHEEAIGSFHQAIRLNPNCAEFHDNLGLAYQRQRNNEAAVACHRRAIELNGGNADAHNNLGNALENQGKTIEAIACYRAAIELKPDFADAHSNLGIALREVGKIDEAIGSLRRASVLDPTSAKILSNLALALQDGGHIEEASDGFRRALALDPDLAGVRVNLAYLTLLLGDQEKGWQEYEWRWKAGNLVERAFEQPRWQGQSLSGKTILLHAEQGLGDTIQFVRYAPLVKGLGGRVVFECQKPLLNLLTTAAGIDCLVGTGDELPSFDFHSPLLSLPGIFNTTLETIPNHVPYLFANTGLCVHWRARLKNVRGFRIGINWHGRAGRRESLQRDIPLTCFSSLANLPGISLISLQQGAGREELKQVGGQLPIVDPGDDVDTAHGAFMDTAAIMMNLDMVITSDTSVAHLAGALGVPVWVALPFVPNWRWLLDRADSPWYPTMRLFRQKKAGNWSGVFEEIHTGVRALTSAGS